MPNLFQPSSSQADPSSSAAAPVAPKFLSRMAQMFDAQRDFGKLVDDMKKENADLKSDIAALKTHLGNHISSVFDKVVQVEVSLKSLL